MIFLPVLMVKSLVSFLTSAYILAPCSIMLIQAKKIKDILGKREWNVPRSGSGEGEFHERKEGE